MWVVLKLWGSYMNKSVLMIMGGALTVAILVAMIVNAKLSPKSHEATQGTQILVAKRSLMTGDTLKPTDVKWQDWPDDGMFKGVIKKTDQPDETKLDVYDAPLRRNIEAGEPITKQALIPDAKGGNNFLAATISPGMRAVGIAVKADTIAGGFVAPGDNVDVVLSYAPDLPSGANEYGGSVIQHYASQTILKNIRVLAVDQSSDENREAKAAKTVTLEVTPDGAEVLALADRMGDITLALRRIGEKDSTENAPLVTDATTSDVLKKLRKIKEAMEVSGSTIRLYSGNTVQNVPVRASSGGEQ